MRIETIAGPSTPKKATGPEAPNFAAENASDAETSMPESDEFSKLLMQAETADKPESAEDSTASPSSLDQPLAPLSSACPVPWPLQLEPAIGRVAKGNAQYGAPMVADSSPASGMQSSIGARRELAGNSLDLAGLNAPISQAAGAKNLPAGIAKMLDKRSNAFADDALAQANAPFMWMQEDASTKNTVLLEVLALGQSAVKPGSDAIAVKPAAHLFQSTLPSAEPNPSSVTGPVPDQPTVDTSPPMADKASYWAAQGTQNMALTLEGQGDEAVLIKVSLSGQEARVDIRTDHLALRQLIEGSFQDMKDKLSGEGLNLSAVSVGTSLQGQGMGQGMGQGSRGQETPTRFGLHGVPGIGSPKGLPPTGRQPGPRAAGALSIFV